MRQEYPSSGLREVYSIVKALHNLCGILIEQQRGDLVLALCCLHGCVELWDLCIACGLICYLVNNRGSEAPFASTCASMEKSQAMPHGASHMMMSKTMNMRGALRGHAHIVSLQHIPPQNIRLSALLNKNHPSKNKIEKTAG